LRERMREGTNGFSINDEEITRTVQELE
jgi:hypothetical protein